MFWPIGRRPSDAGATGTTPGEDAAAFGVGHALAAVIGRHAAGRRSRRARRVWREARRRGRLDAAVRQGEQQPDDERVREQRRAAVRDERQRDARQRHELEVARRDDERLDADHEAETRGEQRPEVVGRRGRDAQAALDHHEVEPEDRQHPDQPQLLAQRGEREVGVDRGNRHLPADHRQAAAEPRADQAAARERVQRLDHLVARAERVLEGIEPDVDPRPDVPEQLVHQRAAQHEQDQAADDVAPARRRDVQQQQEHREEQQRGAEVALDHDDAEGDRPHRGHRQQIRDRRQAQRPDRGRLLDQQRPVLGQVARQEHDQDDLEQLGWLAAQRADVQREPRAVRLAAEDEDEQQQRDPDGRPRVLVHAQPVVGAHGDREDRDEA